MIDWAIFLSMFTIGLVSSSHCIGMCGGIMGALSMAIPATAKKKRWAILVTYNLGRIGSYGLMGLLAGFFAQQFAAIGGGEILRIIAGLLLIAMGFYLANWWRGLTYLEKLGRYLWAYLQPLGKGLMPVNNLPKALGLGIIWGWLPCGLVYSALALAMTQPAPALASGAMLAFGIGTLPSVLAAGVVAQQLAKILQKREIRFGLALLVIIYGVLTIYGAMGHVHHANTSGAHGSEHHEHLHTETINGELPASEAAPTGPDSSINSSNDSTKAQEHHHH